MRRPASAARSRFRAWRRPFDPSAHGPGAIRPGGTSAAAPPDGPTRRRPATATARFLLAAGSGGLVRKIYRETVFLHLPGRDAGGEDMLHDRHLLQRPAVEQRRRRCTIREVAGAYGISENHLVKLTHDLGRRGFVATSRGKNGGLELARPAREINLEDVYRATETSFELAECPSGREKNSCRIAGPVS